MNFLKHQKSKRIIFFIILVAIALFLFRKCMNTTTIMIMTPNDLVVVKSKYLGKTGIVSELTKNMREEHLTFVP